MNRRHFLTGCLATCLPAMPLAGARAASKPRLHVPAEEAPHAMTFLQWPTNRAIYPDPHQLADVQKTIATIANTISAFETVVILAHADQHVAVQRHTSRRVEVWDIPTDDLWCRDSGPLFARKPDGTLAVSHIQFNGWGNKQIHRHDGKVAERLAERLGLDVIKSGLVGEAGGVDHDGHGLLMAHESSWLNNNRNPGLSRQALGDKLLAAYGATQLIWAPGLKGADITDYHIDSLARFTGPGRVLINLPDTPDPEDPFHKAAFQTHEKLKAAGLDISVIPEPVQRRVNQLDFVASYVNYTVCNGAVIAAQFGDSDTDTIAQRALARHYPGREIVMLNVDALGRIGGGIHCATQQMPASKR